MNKLNFSYNWNNKLECKAFTTIRLSSKYNKNEKVIVQLNKVDKFEARIVDVRHFKIDKINEFVAMIDTGYSAAETKDILKKMYSKKNIDWLSRDVYLYLVKKV